MDVLSSGHQSWWHSSGRGGGVTPPPLSLMPPTAVTGSHVLSHLTPHRAHLVHRPRPGFPRLPPLRFAFHGLLVLLGQRISVWTKNLNPKINKKNIKCWMELLGSKKTNNSWEIQNGKEKKKLIGFKCYHVFVVDLETIMSVENSDWLLIWSLVIVHLSNYFFSSSFFFFFLLSCRERSYVKLPNFPPNDVTAFWKI